MLSLLCFLFPLTTSLTWSERMLCPLSGNQQTKPNGGRQGQGGMANPEGGRKYKGVTSVQAELAFIANLLGALAVTALASH